MDNVEYSHIEVYETNGIRVTSRTIKLPEEERNKKAAEVIKAILEVGKKNKRNL